jgi:hypothetical protein
MGRLPLAAACTPPSAAPDRLQPQPGHIVSEFDGDERSCSQHGQQARDATQGLGGVLHEVDGGEWSRRVELLVRVGARWRPFRLQHFAAHRRRIQHVCRGRLPLLRELCCCLSRPSPQRRLACHSFLRFSSLLAATTSGCRCHRHGGNTARARCGGEETALSRSQCQWRFGDQRRGALRSVSRISDDGIAAFRLATEQTKEHDRSVQCNAVNKP